jgi:hypothetical protein
MKALFVPKTSPVCIAVPYRPTPCSWYMLKAYWVQAAPPLLATYIDQITSQLYGKRVKGHLLSFTDQLRKTLGIRFSTRILKLQFTLTKIRFTALHYYGSSESYSAGQQLRAPY